MFWKEWKDLSGGKGGQHKSQAAQVEELRQILSCSIQSGLPGLKAQINMMPQDKLSLLDTYAQKISSARKGAVSVIIFPDAEEIKFYLIRRQNRPRDIHSAQISFPGGKVEDSDASLLHTAIRETKEELDLILNPVFVCGALSSVYIPASHFYVTPFVLVLDKKPSVNPDPKEVSSVLEIPLNLLFMDDIKTSADFNTSYGYIRNYPCYNFKGNIVWGATAMMLAELEWLLRVQNQPF